uniref:RYYR-CCHC domain-containing protein n=1 Tax=Parascaris univalens TaxID=6257 RepID=A0A915AZH4_PARUN
MCLLYRQQFEREIDNEERNISVQCTRSKRLTVSSLVVSDASGDAVRIYRIGSKSKDGRTAYYRCSKCETLSHKSRVASGIYLWVLSDWFHATGEL